MRRWDVHTQGSVIRLYYDNYETAQKKNPDATVISECHDYGYLADIERILRTSTPICDDRKGREVRKAMLGGDYTLVRLYSFVENGKKSFYDMCDFQRYDGFGSIQPKLWTCSTPEEFCRLFLPKDGHVKLPVDFISTNTMRKLNGVRFYNRNGNAFFADSYGYFYLADNFHLPNRKWKDEYERFKGNDRALKVAFYGSDGSHKVAWYASEKEFREAFERYCESIFCCARDTMYRIKMRGYNLEAPEDRKVILRLPYFRLDEEIDYLLKIGTTPKTIADMLAGRWCALMAKLEPFEDAFGYMDLLNELITAWIECREKSHIKLAKKSSKGAESKVKQALKGGESQV